MIDRPDSGPDRYVIDFHPRDILAAGAYKQVFELIEKTVLPVRVAAAAAEKTRNKEVLDGNPDAKVNLHHRNFLNKWWLLSYPRQELIAKIAPLPRYIACGHRHGR
jgi:hypothetical protein